MKQLLTFVTILLISLQISKAAPKGSRPKLVVGVVVDQMRWDFFYRYETKYGKDGFKRLLNGGYSCENTYINYIPSYTAPGHTSVYTGSVPAIHGIAGNHWYSREDKREVYCTEDAGQKTVGAAGKAGMMSPKNLLSSTLADELKLATNFKGKSIGIALKDRGAILPVGHTADAAYFYDGESGNWITSTYYMQQLPQWVTAFNSQKLPEKYVKQNWNTLLPIAQYHESHEDDKPFEQPFKNEPKPVFEHKVEELLTGNYDVIKATPYGNTLTLDFAKAAIQNELLGKGPSTDFLAVSLSSTDYIGHQFGPNSIEVQDCYLRLDKDLADFLRYLDRQVGAGNYVLFLTADHGAAHAQGYMKETKVPGGSVSTKELYQEMNEVLAAKWGSNDWILSQENMQVYLNRELIKEKELDVEDFAEVLCGFLQTKPGIASAVYIPELAEANLEATLKRNITNGIHAKRSGDIFILYEPAWYEGFLKGTTHGSPYPYDLHIPLVWYGWGVPKGKTYKTTYMTDIAPTLAAMLRIQEPNGNIGSVIEPLLHK